MKDQNKIKYFLYARKSSESEDKQVQSIDDQINRLKKLAIDYDLDIKEILTESHSAKAPNARPVFNKMLDRIEKGEANGILCWQINRLSRNPVDSARVQWFLQQRTILSIQTIDGERKPDDNAVLFSVESGVANQYIIDLKKNIRRGLDSKLEKGILPCLAPVGYLNEPYERNIVPDPERFHLMKKMFDMMLTGNYTPNKILTIATKEWGFLTKKTRRAGGKQLSLSNLYRVFTSQFYCGVIEYGGRRYPGKHDTMITLDEFDHIQILLGRKGKSRPKTHTFAFTGLIRCGECDCSITAEQKSKLLQTTGEVKKYPPFYHCTRKKRDVLCNQRSVLREDDLEKQVNEELVKYEIMPEFRKWALEILNESNDKEIAERTQIHETQQKTLLAVQKQMDNLTQMRYRDLINDEEFVSERDKLKNKILDLQQQLKDTEDRAAKWQELTEAAFNFATYARQHFANGDLQTKREILATFGSNPTLKDGKLNVEAVEWLQKMKTGYEPLKERYLRLEPQKNHMNKRQKDAFASLRTEWWRWAESNRRAKDFLKCFYIVYFTLFLVAQKFQHHNFKVKEMLRRLSPTPLGGFKYLLANSDILIPVYYAYFDLWKSVEKTASGFSLS